MIVADMRLSQGDGIFGSAIFHDIRFDDLALARAEYERLVGLMKSREDRKNDLPTMIEVVGAGNRVSLPLNNLKAVSMCDYAKANEQQSGLGERFPNLFKS